MVLSVYKEIDERLFGKVESPEAVKVSLRQSVPKELSDLFLETDEEKLQKIRSEWGQSPEAAFDRYLDMFMVAYRGRYRALEMVVERYEFYVVLSESKSSELVWKHVEELMREIPSQELIVVCNRAIDACLLHGEKLVKKLQAEQEKILGEITSHIRTKQQLRLSDSVLRMHSWNPVFSDCERYGTCVCEKGSKPPYLNGCVSDPTLLNGGSSDERLRRCALENIDSFFDLARKIIEKV